MRVSRAHLICLLLAISVRSFVKGQANFNTTGNFVAIRYASISAARGMILDDADQLLVVSNGQSRITAVYEENGAVSTSVLLTNAGLALNHGIAYNKGYLYASSRTTVYRWPYTPGQRNELSGQETVIKGMPQGGHQTRTLVFDSQDLLYVSVGSNANVDQDSSRARIRRFNLDAGIPNGGIDFGTGEVFADGLRNEVGIKFDQDGVLWGVQNGADMLVRDDLGGDIHNTNPADELTKHDQPLGTHYGYPYCWTAYELANHMKGEQFAWPSFMNDGVHTDEWCKNPSNNRPPTLPLPAHWAALDITFYDGAACNTSRGAFPCSMKGDAFVAFHGSWNIDPPMDPNGYRVAPIPIDPQTRLPTGQILDVMYEPDPAGCGRCFRPVNLVFNRQGHLMVSADTSSELFRITYEI